MFELVFRICFLIKSEKGSVATEYVFLAFAVCIAIAAIVFTIGDQVVGMFGNLSSDLNVSDGGQ